MHVPEKNPSSDALAIQEMFGVLDFPKIIVEQSYDVENLEILESPKQIAFPSSSFKFAEIEKFLKTFALESTKEELEEQAEQKEQ